MGAEAVEAQEQAPHGEAAAAEPVAQSLYGTFTQTPSARLRLSPSALVGPRALHLDQAGATEVLGVLAGHPHSDHRFLPTVAQEGMAVLEVPTALGAAAEAEPPLQVVRVGTALAALEADPVARAGLV